MAAKRRKAAAKKTGVRKTQKPPRKPGPPPFAPTDDQRRQVEAMVGYGLTHAEICTLVINPQTGEGISTRTLHKHFKRELNRGAAMVKAKVTESLVKKALKEDHPQSAVCGMFIMKCRFGWRQEDRAVQVEGGPIAGVLAVPAGVPFDAWMKQVTDANAKKKPPGDG